MLFTNRYISSLLLGCLLGLTTCVDQPLEEEAHRASSSTVVVEPADFARILYPANNLTTSAGLELGRLLFYDPILSADSTISCSSCHLPQLAFTDGEQLAKGIHGKVGRRNSPGLTNIGYNHFSLFWDGRAGSLEEQAIHPVADPLEMANEWPVLIHNLRRHPFYAPAIMEAFELDTPAGINPDHVARALAQFQRSLISSNSRYDRMLRKEVEFTPQERMGWAIFFDRADDPEETDYIGLPTGECAHCHAAPHFSNQEFFNNGLDEAPELTEFSDLGRGGVIDDRYQNGLFKVPSLRNVALTAPFMHDGRFGKLEEVLNHYNSGGHYAPNRSPNVRALGLDPIHQDALIAFLHTLTDSAFIAEQIAIADQLSNEQELGD